MNLAAWAHQLFIALDQLANVLIGLGNDDYYADETLSAHCWRKHLDSVRWNVAMRVIDVLFYWQDVLIRVREGAWPRVRHCHRAFNAERERAGLPREYRS